MPQKGKMPNKEIVQLIEDYLTGKKGFTEAYKIAGISKTTWRKWISRYKVEGAETFLPYEKNRIYSAELKTNAVRDYLDEKGSLKDICEMYRIRTQGILRRWIQAYNRHEELKTLTGGSRMTTGRKTTKEERLAIAEECIARGNNYGEIALKYSVSYQQIYTWVNKVKEQGEAGLDDRRGHRPPPKEPQTEEERLKAEVAQLQKANYRLQMENDFLKKLKEVERRNR